MSARWSGVLAWSLAGVCLLIAVPETMLSVTNQAAESHADLALPWVGASADAFVLLVMVAVGALVAARRPENVIGWLFCCVALASEVGSLGIQYAVYALKTAPGRLPGGVAAGLFGNCARSIGWYLLLTFLLLLFPNGRLPTPKWRPAAWLTGAIMALYCVVALLVQDALANADARLATVVNPLAPTQYPDVMGMAEGGAILLMFAATVVCVASLVVRFRRARGVERQQLKWFVFTVVCGLVLFGCIVVTMFLPGSPGVLGFAFDLVLIALPVTTGIAVLRYRLFDIDVIIRRTLIYAALTAVLAAVYFAVVLGAQVVGERLTGQAEPPAWLIVITTLGIAALFTPLRRRVQRVIDRRFYRSRYDAARTVEGFAATLRTELDLTALSGHLVGVVEETMRPAGISLWLRAPREARLRREDMGT